MSRVFEILSRLLATLLVLAPSAFARAQTCTTGPRVPFAGHDFPLDAAPNPAPMTPVRVYPNVTLDGPVFLASPPDGTNRIFVVERAGAIRILPTSQSGSTTKLFLDLRSTVTASDQEQGLLGLAFDPDYATSRRFYVSYTATGARCAGAPYCSVVESYRAMAGEADRADAASRVELLSLPRTNTYHNGGMLAFGADGMLYASFGDDGRESPAQDLAVLLGKLVRIDPRGATPYAIPPDNPFVGVAGARPEIFAHGFRNPWRFSFDRATGDLWVGDVGQNEWEEIDFVAAGSSFVRDFGWPFCEGSHDYGGNVCAARTSTPPVVEYHHDSSGGFAVTGGYVYRGDRLASPYGAYVYADYISGRVWARSGPAGPSTEVASLGGISSFGEDASGELYLVTISGQLYQLQENGDPVASELPAALSGTGLFSDVAALTPVPGLVEYEVNSPLWSDRALKRRWLALPAGERISFAADGDWDFPVGTAFVKHFELPTSPTARVRVETRVLFRQNTRWAGYTYRWNTAQTDAFLVTSPETGSYTVDVGGVPTPQTWHFPSPADCLSCHTSAAGRVLGVRTVQLNKTFPYPGGGDNQLHAWASCLNLFQEMLQTPDRYGSYADPANASETLNARARSYLAANCAHCHRPLGPAPGGLDLRYAPLLGGMNVIGVPPTEGTLGLPNALRVRPGVKEQSVLWARVGSSDVAVHMPRGSFIPDPLAVSLLGSWIDGGLSALDSDDDGVPDASDNCPAEPNASQSDAGGFLSSSPDGVGDACQCLDVTSSAQITVLDPARLRTYLAGSSANVTPGLERRSNDPERSGRASVLDLTKLRRALSSIDPPPPQVCPAATALQP